MAQSFQPWKLALKALQPNQNLAILLNADTTSTLAMLCDKCKSIDVDKLIPPEESLKAGVVSGTRHHASFADLEDAAKAGCEFCTAIERCTISLIKQPQIRRRLASRPVDLKMILKGHANPGYQGGSRLWASCEGKIIAQLEVFVPRCTKPFCGGEYRFNNSQIRMRQILNRKFSVEGRCR